LSVCAAPLTFDRMADVAIAVCCSIIGKVRLGCCGNVVEIHTLLWVLMLIPNNPHIWPESLKIGRWCNVN
jgi:hypothetical protein